MSVPYGSMLYILPTNSYTDRSWTWCVYKYLFIVTCRLLPQLNTVCMLLFLTCLRCSQLDREVLVRLLVIICATALRGSHCVSSEVPYLLLIYLSFSALDGRCLHAVRSKLSTVYLSFTCQETETCMVRACYTPQQPLQNHPSGHLGEWATPWSVEDMLDGQHRRADIPARARTAHMVILQKRLEEDFC